jgi:3-methyladenine DNA glycosylase AlkD
MQVADVLSRLRALSDPRVQAALERSGSHPRSALGVSAADLRKLADEIGIDRLIAQQLWASGIHEARLLASLIDDPERVTSKQMERWVRDFDTWDLCDACCENLFHKTPFAFGKVSTWSGRREEYVKRAAFSLLASLAAHDKASPDSEFLRFLPVIVREAGDERPLVRKAIAAALRQVGQRKANLRKAALQTVSELDAHESRSARLIAAEASKELSKAPAPKATAARKKTAKKTAKKTSRKKTSRS